MFKPGDQVIWKPQNSGIWIGIVLAEFRCLEGIQWCICQNPEGEQLKFIAPITQLTVYLGPQDKERPIQDPLIFISSKY